MADLRLSVFVLAHPRLLSPRSTSTASRLANADHLKSRHRPQDTRYNTPASSLLPSASCAFSIARELGLLPYLLQEHFRTLLLGHSD